MADEVGNLHHQPQDAAFVHGGNLAVARHNFPEATLPWIDLSTGINPWPYPLPPLPADAWSRLPQAEGLAALNRAAADNYGTPSPDHLVAVPGTQAAIQQLPRLHALSGNAGTVAVVGPTYGEHKRGWEAAGHQVVAVPDLEHALALAPAPAVVVIVNPNNPDGRRVAAATLIAAASVLAQTRSWLVVDEAFADPDPLESVASAAGMPGLIVLRSFGKFYGLAGLRLGFVLAEPDLCRRLEDYFGPWAVSGPALHIGAAALSDSSWIRGTRARLSHQSTRLQEIAAVKGIEVVGSTPLFTLLSADDAGALFAYLAKAGIWTRPFREPQNWLRLGLPPNDAALQRLKTALELYSSII